MTTTTRSTGLVAKLTGQAVGYLSRASDPASRKGKLGIENAAGESTLDGPLPFGGTLCPACSSICESHVDLSPGSRCLTVLLRPKRIRLSTMSTIELVDPELRDALALWPQVPLTAETLRRRRADALALLSSVPTPDLPDIATGEIHIESAFGAKPIRVLTYRPVRSADPLPVIVHIHGGGFVMGTPWM